MSLLFYLKSILYWWSKLSFSWLRISNLEVKIWCQLLWSALDALTSMPARWAKMSLSPSVCICPISVTQESSMGTVMQTPLDSTHNQGKFKTQEKSFSQNRNCIPDLYMLETVFNFLHGSLLYVLFWFASNPVFYCKRQFLLLDSRFDVQLNATSQLSLIFHSGWEKY